MVDYPALGVRLAGWSGLAQAEPTGRCVVLVDEPFRAADDDALKTARPFIGSANQDNKAFEVDEGSLAVLGSAGAELSAASPRVARTYRVRGVEIDAQPDCVIGIGDTQGVEAKLKLVLKQVSDAVGLTERRLTHEYVESIGSSEGRVHVLALWWGEPENGQRVTDPRVALLITEAAAFTDGSARFEVTSRHRFPGDQAARPSDGVFAAPDEWPLVSYRHELMAKEDPEPVQHDLIAVVDGYFDLHHVGIKWYENEEGEKVVVDALGAKTIAKDAHGTSCAGVAAPRGGLGASPEVRVLPVRVYDPAELSHSELALARGIVGAVKMGASVISVSLARPVETSSVVRAAVDYAEEKGRVVVAAAGNPSVGQHGYPVWYPAAYDTVIAVGAARITGGGLLERVVDGRPLGASSFSATRWASAYGPGLDVVSQGEDVRTTDLMGTPGRAVGDFWEGFRGTSAAAPAVAGVALGVAAEFRHELDEDRPKKVRDRIAAMAAAVPLQAVSPGFNVTRRLELEETRHPYSEQLGFGWIHRTAGATG